MEETCPTGRVENILLATDGLEYSEGAIREAIKLTKKCSGRLTAVSVIETNPELEAIAPQVTEQAQRKARSHLDTVRELARTDGVDCECVIREGEDSYRYIVEEAAKRRNTMIVMGRHGKSGLKRLVMGSTTAWVIGHAPCSVLVAPRASRLEYMNLLVATDGSQYSAAAASGAVDIAKLNGSRLTIVAVVPAELATPTDVDFSVAQREKLSDEVMRDAEKNARVVKEEAVKEGVSAQAFVMTGRPADAIIETAREKGADLVVLGSHGRTGIERLLMGSVAERVIVLSPCPVLVVKTA